MQHPDGDWKCETWPVRFDGKPPELKPSPKLGQHTDEVFASWLKMSNGDIQALHERKGHRQLDIQTTQRPAKAGRFVLRTAGVPRSVAGCPLSMQCGARRPRSRGDPQWRN